MTIANVDLLPNSSNHKAIFPEYLKNIPQISVSNIFQGYPQNIVTLWKCFYGVKNSKNVFVGYPVKCLILVASSFEMFFWTLLKLSFIDSQEFRVMLWKGSYRCSAAGKNLILAQHYYQYITLWWLLQIFTVRYLIYQCVPHSGKSL